MAGRSATQIAVDIEQDIQRGALTPGQQLTSVRQLSAELGVSPTTVAGAYRRLRDRGLVAGRGRQGTRVAPRPQSDRPVAPEVVAGLVDALNGSPDPRLLPDLDRALAAAIRHDQPRYGDALVIDELIDAASAGFTADGVDPRHMTVTSGSMDAIERVLRAQGFRAGDRIGMEDPGHTPAHQVARSAGLELVPLPIDEEGITPEGLAASLARGLAAVIITPRAQNPTGAALSAKRATELTTALAPHRELTLVHDDHAGPIAGTPYFAVRPPGPRWATIRSLGKSYGPDLRLALVAGDSQTVARMTTAIGNGPGWVSHILQRAAAFLLTDPVTATAVDTAAAAYGERRQLLIASLASQGIAASGRSGLNVWIPTTDEQAAVGAARRAGYAIRAADPWRINSGPAVRVSITNLENWHIEELSAALGPRPIHASSTPV